MRPVEPSMHAPVARLRDLPAADRRAVLARLSADERRDVMRAMVRAPDEAVASPYAADIAARIAGADAAMTPAARTVLVQAVDDASAPVAVGAGPSLLTRLSDLLRGR